MIQVTHRELMPGVRLTAVHTNKFKSNLLSLSLMAPLSEETASANALLPYVLRRGTPPPPPPRQRPRGPWPCPPAPAPPAEAARFSFFSYLISLHLTHSRPARPTFAQTKSHERGTRPWQAKHPPRSGMLRRGKPLDSAPQICDSPRDLLPTAQGPRPGRQGRPSAVRPLPEDGCLALSPGTHAHRASILYFC